MTEAVFRALLDAILALFRRRSQSIMRALPYDGAKADNSIVDALFHEVDEHRRLAHAAGVLFLRGQARKNGGDEAWVPQRQPYRRSAIRQAIRETPGGLRRGNEEQVQRVLDRHVEGAARQAVVHAVLDAPRDVGEAHRQAQRVVEDLKEFPPSVRREAKKAAEREALEASRREEQNRRRKKPEKKQKTPEKPAAEKPEKPGKPEKTETEAEWRPETPEERRARRKKALEDAFDKIADRVGEAIEEADSEPTLREIIHKKAPLAVEDIPDPDRHDKQGRKILKAFAWARVVHPGPDGPCGFCAMLAGRGPVYRTQGTAAFAYHNSDRCTCVPVFTTRSWPGKKASAEYADVYNRAVKRKGLHGAEARTAMDNALRGTRSRAKSAKRKERTDG